MRKFDDNSFNMQPVPTDSLRDWKVRFLFDKGGGFSYLISRFGKCICIFFTNQSHMCTSRRGKKCKNIP